MQFQGLYMSEKKENPVSRLANEMDSYLCEATDRMNELCSENPTECSTRTAIILLVAALESCVDTLADTIRATVVKLGAYIENVSKELQLLTGSTDQIACTIEYKD
jgi:hypothetical protein